MMCRSVGGHSIPNAGSSMSVWRPMGEAFRENRSGPVPGLSSTPSHCVYKAGRPSHVPIRNDVRVTIVDLRPDSSTLRVGQYPDWSRRPPRRRPPTDVPANRPRTTGSPRQAAATCHPGRSRLARCSCGRCERRSHRHRRLVGNVVVHLRAMAGLARAGKLARLAIQRNVTALHPVFAAASAGSAVDDRVMADY